MASSTELLERPATSTPAIEALQSPVTSAWPSPVDVITARPAAAIAARAREESERRRAGRRRVMTGSFL
jgi:hypothetical protein